MFCFQHCVVAYKENENKLLKKALVIKDAICDLPKVGTYWFLPILNCFSSADCKFVIFSISTNYYAFYRLKTINLMM